MTNKEFSSKWTKLKDKEISAREERIKLEEDFLKTREGMPDEGVVNLEGAGMEIRFRLVYKVDGEKLQVLASEAGLEDHLSSLFRWTPDVNIRAWRSTDNSIKQKLSQAITIKPSKPSFKTKEE